MSLSFHQGDLPSSAPKGPSRRPSAQASCLVATSGNDGVSAASWPAAKPLVIGVGSASTVSDKDEMKIAS